MKLINRIERLLGVKMPSKVFEESLGEMIDINEFVEKKKAPAEMQTVNKGENSQKLSYPNCTIDELRSQVLEILKRLDNCTIADITRKFIILHGEPFDINEFYRYLISECGGVKNDS